MIDFTTELKDLDGKPVQEMIGPQELVTLTLGRVAANALTSAIPGEPPAAGADHIARLQLALKVREAKGIELSAGDITTIKERIAKFYTNSIVVGHAWLLLDPLLAK